MKVEELEVGKKYIARVAYETTVVKIRSVINENQVVVKLYLPAAIFFGYTEIISSKQIICKKTW